MNFINQQYEIKCLCYATDELKVKMVNGKVAEGIGLGYHQNESGWYVPTHLASGYGLGYHLLIEGEMQQWIEALAALWDWNMPAKHFMKLKKRDKVRVHGCLTPITLDYEDSLRGVPLDTAERLRERSKELALAEG